MTEKETALLARRMVWSLRAGSVRIVAKRGGGLNVGATNLPPRDVDPGARAVSKSMPVSEGDADNKAPTKPVNPLKNPSYPQREHIHERAHWQGILASCEDRISAARRKLDSLGNGSSGRDGFARLYTQMLGARDQVADAARRLPGETGDLYTEDRHRLEEAVAALDRVFKRWDAGN